MVSTRSGKSPSRRVKAEEEEEEEGVEEPRAEQASRTIGSKSRKSSVTSRSSQADSSSFVAVPTVRRGESTLDWTPYEQQRQQQQQREEGLNEQEQRKEGGWGACTYSGYLAGQSVVCAIFFMVTTPNFCIAFHHILSELDGNFGTFCKICYTQGFFHTMYTIWPSPWDPTAWKLIAAFLGFELFLQKVMPGKIFEANTTATGNRPIYKANGMASYLVTLITLLALTALGYIRPALVYDKFGNILASMNVFSLALCLVLLVKGYVAPSSSDSGSNGNFIIDFYWGMELYPRIFGWDVKMFTNCRAGMMFWAVGILCFAHKNMEIHHGQLQIGMAVNVALQLIYITKFFHWEMGYMCSMDIQHDRAGYYLCWGCLNWLPCVYTSHSYYLAEHGPDVTIPLAALIFTLGFLSIWINYDSDNQRYVFRRTNGECTIWGRRPDRIVAEYTTSSGEIRKSLLLLGGWWKVSRHFHYVPEIMASFFWCSPALNTAFWAPYFYVIYLTLLLSDRACRDDDRCRAKYGIYWENYCKEVPYMIVPGIV